MFATRHLTSLSTHGFCKLDGLYGEALLASLRDEAELLVRRTYTAEGLAQHSVYPSDAGHARISHAVMIAGAESDLPTVNHHDLPTVDRFLRDFNAMLADVTGAQVPDEARCMLNYQNYFEGSKPVGEHFDGEYLRTERHADGIEFTLEEGILPRFVAVLVVANQNDGKGTELVDNAQGAVHRPRLDPGDLLFFDNVRLRHRVPTMVLPRTTIGIRSFDHRPVHFARTREFFLPGNYRPIAEGWVSEDADCAARLRRFMAEEWPRMKDDYAHYF